MSPLVIVGITLLTTALADVSHVLQGQAHPPAADPQEVNDAFGTKAGGDFWWMQDDSPLKASYDYFKKCAATGKCSKHSIDVQKNIFLNGDFANQGGSSSFSESISANSAKGLHSDSNIDLSTNPFLSGGFAHAGQDGITSGALCKGNDRLCVKKEDCVSGVVSSKGLIQIRSNSDECTENEICCKLPLTGKSSLADHVNQLVFTPGKSSVLGSQTKITGLNGLSPREIQIIHSSQEGIRPQFNFIGESGSSTIKPVRDVTAASNQRVFSSTPDYSNVNFGNEARFSDLDGPDYLPPHPGPSCPPGQYVNHSGQCEPVIKPCPPGTRPTGSGGCEKLKVNCPPGQILGQFGCEDIPTRPPPTCGPGQKPGPYGGCIPIQTPPPPTPGCPPGQKRGPYGCVPIQTPPPPTPPPSCGPGQKPGPYGGCVPIQTPPPIITTEKPYCAAGQREGPNGQCIDITPPPPTCGPGQKPGPYGGCVPIQTPPPPTPPPSCGPGQKPGPYGGCVPIQTRPPPIITTTEKPYCASGQREGPNGQCIDITQPTCGPGQKPGPFGGCVTIQTTPPPTQACPPGQKRGPYGCVPIQTPPTPTCGPGQKPGPYGGCVPIQTPPPIITTEKPYCASGQREGPNGQCIDITQPTCGPGQKPGPFGGCVPIQTPPPTTQACPPGQKRGPYGCVPIQTPPTTTPRPSCGPGQKPGPYGGCVPIQTPPPVITTEKPYCASGQREGPNGECIDITQPTCGPGQKPGPFGGCVPIQTPPTTTPRPSCGPGQRPGPYGGCVPIQTPPTTTPRPSCGPGQKPGPYGGCVPIQTPPPVITTERPYCASGQREGPNGECIDITQPTCGPGQKPGPFGGCVQIQTPTPPCPSGQKRGPYGCVPIQTPPTTTPRPSCGPGQKPGPYGGCVPIQTPPPTTTPRKVYCAAGQREGPNGECIDVTPPPPSCGPGQKPGPYGGCVPIQTPPPPTTRRPYCAAGQREGPDGQCIDITRPPPSCGPGQKPGPYGGCVPIQTPPPPTKRPYCAAGQREGPNGQCIDITPPPPSCGPGQKPGPYGGCVPIQTPPPPTKRPYCAAGQREGPNGQCIDITPPPPSCGPGEKVGSYGQCVPIPTLPPIQPTCPPGQKPGPYGGCVAIERPTPPRPCPPGTIKTPSGRCETPPTPPPVTCPPGSYFGTSGNCVRPTPPPTTTSRIYLPPKTQSTTSGGNRYTPTPKYTGGYDIYPGDLDKTGSPGSNVPVKVRPPGQEQNHTINHEDLIPVGCAAALKCVQEIYCTADGLVSPVPVVLTKEQELLRAPTVVCRDVASGTLGKCCRDPNYQDPWPSANLVNGVDDGQYAEDDSIGQYQAQYNRFSRSSRGNARKSRAKRATENCGVRNLNTSPPGPRPIDANFAEITWQAMILKDSNRSLLCGGSIIGPNAVLTAAHCLEGQQTSDILIKGGEWKLGIDEEPLPFQIIKVAAILRHPEYTTGSKLNDLAVLILEENLRFTQNIGDICLPEPNLIPTQNCIVTGWGKRILQLHARGAIMHRIDMNIMDVQQCQQVLSEHFPKKVSDYNPNTLCGFSDIDQCRVDYGSALACANENGQYILSGVFTWDTGCKQQGQIGGYVAPDVEWIADVLATPLKQLKRIDRAYNAAKMQEIV